MIGVRRLPMADEVGNPNATTVSRSRLSHIIAVMATILSVMNSCDSLVMPTSNQQLCKRRFVGVRHQCTQNTSTGTSSVSPTSLKASSAETIWSARSILGRKDAQSLLDGPKFLPSVDYGNRIVFGRQAAEKEHGGSEELGVMLSDDPRLARTYAEFPLESLDLLLDQAVRYLPEDVTSSGTSLNMVDIGSGLGRIVLYSALTRGTNDGNEANWEVRGIEISPSLHNKALELVQTGIDMDIFEENENQEINSFLFHCGSATDGAGRKLLEDAHLVFSYSTAFKAKSFDPEVGAMILDTEEWSLPLSEVCPDGCVVVTTDRALNPNLGWKLIERIDVPNPEVLGTTGFIHVLEKGSVQQ